MARDVTGIEIGGDMQTHWAQLCGKHSVAVEYWAKLHVLYFCKYTCNRARFRQSAGFWEALEAMQAE